MSAIEMMDPKMDAGMMCNQIQRKVHNLEQAVEVSGSACHCWQQLCVFVCVCETKRERERVCACVCVRLRERER